MLVNKQDEGSVPIRIIMQIHATGGCEPAVAKSVESRLGKERVMGWLENTNDILSGLVRLCMRDEYICEYVREVMIRSLFLPCGFPNRRCRELRLSRC